jgi:hypothetical protein
LFTFGSFLLQKYILDYLFPTEKFAYLSISTKYGLGYILGDFFHKLIRSPWSTANFYFTFGHNQCEQKCLGKTIEIFDNKEPFFALNN